MQLNNPASTKNMATLHLRKSIGRSPLRHGFFLALALGGLALLPTVKAGLSPAPDGFYDTRNTAEGKDALFSLNGGTDDTAIGFDALYKNTSGSNNTATGSNALYSNTIGGYNTATGTSALYSNTEGIANTAYGHFALYFNTFGSQNTANGNGALFGNGTGSYNTANGFDALESNSTGNNNTANGAYALDSNDTGGNNTANGFSALLKNTSGLNNTAEGMNALYRNSTGNYNTANGGGALYNNTTGNNNTAHGYKALLASTTGSSNIALGYGAGSNITTGSNNIDIGNAGVAGESGKIHIGIIGTQNATFIAGIHGATASGGAAVYVNSSGQLGTSSSSARFKQDIHSMDKASEAVLSLKPVTFRYKEELDPDGIPQFGLVAEEVEKVNPALVTRDAEGKIYSVRYEAVNAMLLNEFLKEHLKVQEQEAIITQVKSIMAKQEATIAQQQKGIEVLTAAVKEQALQIQKVNDRLELNKPAPQTVVQN
jgi:hypothetical protein